MHITHELLFERIKQDPVKHLGGCSPSFIFPYFGGYEHARRFHGKPDVAGRLSLRQFGKWFCEKAYGGPQGFARYCILLTDTDETALELFYEFRKLALKDFPVETKGEQTSTASDSNSEMQISFTDLVLHDAMRTKTALYFGNDNWISSMWAMWNGFVLAEKDLGVTSSTDAQNIEGFQLWLDKRYPFAEEKNWGKLFEFLGMGVKENAREQFYDHFELFLEGEPPDSKTKRCREWMEGVLADVKERQKKGEV